MTKKLSLSQAAKKHNISRQRIHKWLQDNNLLDRCEAVSGLSGKKTAFLLIPESLLERAPFVVKKHP